MVGSESPNGSSPQPAKKYGITKPISLAGPTEPDRHRNMELEKFLIDSGLYESEEEASRRKVVLDRIDEIVKSWVRQLTHQKGYTEQMVEDANAVILTFGSYRLGMSENNVLTQGCTNPRHGVSRKCTFGISKNPPFQWLIGRFCPKEDMICPGLSLSH